MLQMLHFFPFLFCYILGDGIDWFQWVSRERTVAVISKTGCKTWHAVWETWEEWPCCFKSGSGSSCWFCPTTSWQRGRNGRMQRTYNDIHHWTLYPPRPRVLSKHCLGETWVQHQLFRMRRDWNWRELG